MRISAARERMLAGQPVLGVVSVLGAPLVAEVLSLCGLDYVIVDRQHGAWDDATTMEAFRAILLGSAVPMVRVQGNDYAAIGRALDQGAQGVIVPMVNSVAEAEAAVYAARYPPQGGRSFGPFGAGIYGSDYEERANGNILLLVQIETKQAAEHAGEILAVDGVDGCWIGPKDLSKSMGVEPVTPEGLRVLEAAIQNVLTACNGAQKIPGIFAGGAAQHRLEQGFLFVTVCGDDWLIVDGAKRALEELPGYQCRL